MSNIPSFPNFSKVSIEQRIEYEKILDAFEPYSDFNFTSLFCWDTDGSAGLSILNNNVVIRLPDYMTGETVYSMIGTQDIEATLMTILAVSNELNFIPEIVVKSIDQSDTAFSIEEDRDNYDYIFSVDELTKMEGGKFKKKRNKLYKLTNDIGHRLSTTHSTTIDGSKKLAILELFNKWVKETGEKAEDAQAEAKAISRILDHFAELNTILTEVRLDNELIGFSMNQLLSNGYAICHFEKALRVHENIYTYVGIEAVKELAKQNVEYLNWEQDLGIPGLRQSKEAYQPIKYLKKYTLRKA